jgi:hypothetical protein
MVKREMQMSARANILGRREYNKVEQHQNYPRYLSHKLPEALRMKILLHKYFDCNIL